MEQFLNETIDIIINWFHNIFRIYISIDKLILGFARHSLTNI